MCTCTCASIIYACPYPHRRSCPPAGVVSCRCAAACSWLRYRCCQWTCRSVPATFLSPGMPGPDTGGATDNTQLVTRGSTHSLTHSTRHYTQLYEDNAWLTCNDINTQLGDSGIISKGLGHFMQCIFKLKTILCIIYINVTTTSSQVNVTAL